MLVDGCVWLIRLYQRTLSHVVGMHCRFTPSCSQYAIDALRRYGLFVGGVKAAWRIVRCNPWGGHGHDPA